MEVIFQNPETVQTLVNAGAVSLVLIAVMALVWLFRSLSTPYDAMAKIISQSQESIAKAMNKLSDTLEINTEVNQKQIELLKNALHADDAILSYLTQFDDRVEEVSHAIGSGIIIHNGVMDIQYISQDALEILGWEKTDVPGQGRKLPPVLMVNGDTLPEEDWPGNIVHRTGMKVENLPLQVYSYAKQEYNWVLVNAYPCLGVQSDLKEVPDWVTVVLKRIPVMHKL